MHGRALLDSGQRWNDGAHPNGDTGLRAGHFVRDSKSFHRVAVAAQHWLARQGMNFGGTRFGPKSPRHIFRPLRSLGPESIMYRQVRTDSYMLSTVSGVACICRGSIILAMEFCLLGKPVTRVAKEESARRIADEEQGL